MRKEKSCESKNYKFRILSVLIKRDLLEVVTDIVNIAHFGNKFYSYLSYFEPVYRRSWKQ